MLSMTYYVQNYAGMHNRPGLGHGHMPKNNVSAVPIHRLIKMAFPVFHDIEYIYMHGYYSYINSFTKKLARYAYMYISYMLFTYQAIMYIRVSYVYQGLMQDSPCI